jgi:hypothetical protein
MPHELGSKLGFQKKVQETVKTWKLKWDTNHTNGLALADRHKIQINHSFIIHPHACIHTWTTNGRWRREVQQTLVAQV